MSFPRADQRLLAIRKGLTLDLDGINSGERFPSGGETAGKRTALIRSLFEIPRHHGFAEPEDWGSLYVYEIIL